MATSTRLSLLEYLKTSYRPTGNMSTASSGAERGKVGACATSGSLASLVPVLRKRAGPLRSPRNRDCRFLSPVSAFRTSCWCREPTTDVIVKPPVLVVEILSQDDTYTETQSRSADYLHMGVPCVWMIDPTSRTGRHCIGDAWTAAMCWRSLEQRFGLTYCGSLPTLMRTKVQGAEGVGWSSRRVAAWWPAPGSTVPVPPDGFLWSTGRIAPQEPSLVGPCAVATAVPGPNQTTGKEENLAFGHIFLE